VLPDGASRAYSARSLGRGEENAGRSADPESPSERESKWRHMPIITFGVVV
jgi:hypothetical protein